MMKEIGLQSADVAADVRLLLKPKVKVMIIWNISDTLRNGTLRNFLGVRNGMLEVDVEGQGTVYVKRETWLKRDRSGQIVGSHTQFLLVLFYACTCHKVQGLSLTKEFIPGLIYLAVSGGHNEQNVQLCKFSSKLLLKPAWDALSVLQHQRRVCRPFLLFKPAVR